AHRLRVYGIDLRHTPSVEQLCRHLLATLARLDGIINNACQTVRRPAGWYDHVLDGEGEPPGALERAFLDRDRALRGELAAAVEPRDGIDPQQGLVRAAGTAIAGAGIWRS